MDFELAPELRSLQAEARDLGREAAARSALTEDTWIAAPDRAFSLELGKRGWLGMTWPVEAGGGGRSPLERFLVFEALIGEGAPLATSWFADRQMGPTLLQFGTPEQQATHLPAILDGTSAWSIGMSEPDAGSDVASIRTRAERDGDDFVVNGQKIWNSGAASADWIYLIVRTDPEAPKHQGLSELIVDLRAPGITIQPIRDMTGNDHFCEVWFEDVRVPVANLVGELNGSFRQVMRQMEHERGGIDRLLSNRKLYLDCRAVADTADPRVRQEVAAIETGYRIGRLMVLQEVLGQAPKQFSAATKTFCTELEQRIAAFCAAVAGPTAMLAEPGLADPRNRPASIAPQRATPLSRWQRRSAGG
jgi:alkylation response protein AidB-like acyl-CoA dehydrogenase